MAKTLTIPTVFKLRGILLQAKKTATGLKIPGEIVEKLGAGKRPPVKVIINEHAYRSSIASMGGIFMLGVSAEVREKACVQGGDDIEFTIELDTQPRKVELPADFKKALEQHPKAGVYFETLSFSNQQRLVLPLGQAKTPETRLRRIDKAMKDLTEGILK